MPDANANAARDRLVGNNRNTNNNTSYKNALNAACIELVNAQNGIQTV